MKILVTGSRDLKNTHRPFIHEVLRTFPPYRLANSLTLIHGGSVGADLIAKEWAESLNHETKEYLPNWKRHGRAAGPLRNQEMLDAENPDYVIAFVNKPLMQSRGTNDCVTRAAVKSIPVYVWNAESKRFVAWFNPKAQADMQWLTSLPTF